ncbi:MAG: 3-phosphoshikimate 1-carboxyvinyltransferase [Fusobacterium sp.]|nr:3-phosphoshikimate 1-carboxyvinyltransferase [Fusobacterium sp.]
MADIKVSKNSKGLRGSVEIPADKSISHRAVMFSSLAKGKSLIRNFSSGADPHSTLEVFSRLGIRHEFIDEKTLAIFSDGNLQAPQKELDCGNSGTTMRLMSGILAGQNFDSKMIGDASLSKRPMKRVIEPVSMMGGCIEAVDGHAPLKIFGRNLSGIDYVSKIASAQVKSCVLLAGMFADGVTSVTEPFVSRNHTELMLKYLGADLTVEGKKVSVRCSELTAKEINICGDISSAAFFIVAGLIVPNSDIILKNVGLNPTRTGILDVISAMGGQVEVLDAHESAGEAVGDLRVKYSDLKACEISGEIIPRLIDELPVIAVLASQAEGQTVVKDAGDLRNKESDRISALVCELKKIGIDIEETPDGFIINGKVKIVGGAEVETYHDHRLAMSLYVAGLVAEKEILVKDFEWVDISFPEFLGLFASL